MEVVNLTTVENNQMVNQEKRNFKYKNSSSFYFKNILKFADLIFSAFQLWVKMCDMYVCHEFVI